MEEVKLPKKFWEENKIDALSFAQNAYFSMTTGYSESISTKMLDMLIDEIRPQRLVKIQNDRKRIEDLQTPEDIITFLRSEYDLLLRELVCRKVLKIEDEVLPLLLRRFKTTCHDDFVDGAAYILGNCDIKYVDELLSFYDEIRDPYAQCMACLVFGVRRKSETAALLLKEYQRLADEYPDEEYSDGPLLALHILYDKV